MVDDDPNDQLLVKTALEHNSLDASLKVVRDGEEAMHYLKGDEPFSDREAFPFPNVILTDLKMPGMDGFELLRWVRKQPECGTIPTIVFSSSQMEEDVRQAYKLGANSFLVKPNDLKELVRLMRVIYEYWSRCEGARGARIS